MKIYRFPNGACVFTSRGEAIGKIKELVGRDFKPDQLLEEQNSCYVIFTYNTSRATVSAMYKR